jgi:deoxyribodipyrimidine photolyase-related protein
MPSGPIRWLFGDQLGPHFADDFLDQHDGPVLLVESRRVFARRAFHRQKAHLVLSAMRHRAAELGTRCRYARVERYATPSPRRTARSR